MNLLTCTFPHVGQKKLQYVCLMDVGAALANMTQMLITKK